jgi:hypothetical protein
MKPIYTTRFLNGHAGCTRVLLIPFIFIDPQYKGDAGLLAHEQVHVRQAWRNIFPPIHALRYALSDKYKLACEVEAYKVQLQYNPHAAEQFANFIATRYDLNITQQEALERLNG